MIFSKEQLNQLAKSNGYSINKLISNRKKLAVLKLRKKNLQDQIKNVVSSSEGDLPTGSSLLMGTINTQLLLDLGYSDIEGLVKEFEANNNNINEIEKSVVEEDSKIKKTLNVLKKVDITKDMEDQVTQEVLLNSDLAEVKNNSQEILLMLSQSKNSSDVLNIAKKHVNDNEAKLAKYLSDSKSEDKAIVDKTSLQLTNLNDSSLNIIERMKALKTNKDLTLLDSLNAKISNLSKSKKNWVLVGTFVSFLGLGIASNGSSKDTSNNKKKD